MSQRALLSDRTTTALSGTIRGSAPMRGIKVVLVRRNHTIADMQSGADGKYQFPNLAPGDYQIKIRRFGYRPIHEVFEKLPGGFEIFSDLYMKRCPVFICAWPEPLGRCE